MQSSINGVSSLSNKLGVLNVSFKDMFATLSKSNRNLKTSPLGFGYSRKELLGNMFANTNTSSVTEMDYQMLERYNIAVKNNISSTDALRLTMQGASKGARDLAMAAKGSQVDLKGLSIVANTSKVAMVGLKAATVALNMALTMGISWGISKLFEGLDYLVNLKSKLGEEAKELAEQTREAANAAVEKEKSLDYIIEKYKELAQSLIKYNSSTKVGASNARSDKI